VIFFPPGSIAGSAGTTGTLNIFNNNGGNNDGFTAGGTVGFNYQTGAVVFGVEADLNWADIGRDGNRNFGGSYLFTGVPGLAFAPPPATVVTNGNGVDWFGTIRGRLGFAFDRTLVFGTGGFAFGGSGNNNGFCGGLVAGCSNDDDWRGGWTVGGGVEYAFTNNLTAKVEGLYVNLGNGDNNNVGAVYSLPTNTLFLGNGRNGDDSFGVVRAGINYKFGS
jgi:outer membrane immunogenic protein